MKKYERRTIAAYPYYKLALWCPRSMTWTDINRKTFASEAEAAAFARGFGPGRYRVSEVDEDGRLDRAPFEVSAEDWDRAVLRE